MESERHDFEAIDSSGGVDEFRLKRNGLQLLLYREATAPVVTVIVTYRAGSADEGSGRTGGMHFLEHMMFKGTRRFNRGRGTSVFDVLQRVGAQLNATTSKDRTNYYEVLPSEYVGLALDIEADRMRGALLLPDDVESEITVILNEIDRAENEPLGNLYRSLWKTAYSEHPYGNPTLGSAEHVALMTSDTLRALYDSHYWPDRTTLAVIGDFDTEEVLSLAARHFGCIPAAPAKAYRTRTEEPGQARERRLQTSLSVQFAAIMVGFKTPATLHPDTPSLDVLAGIMASGKTGRLYRHLTDRGLTTHVSVGAQALREPGLLTISAVLTPGRTHEEVETAIMEIIAAIQNDGVTEEELQRTRNQIRALEAFGRDGSYAIAASLSEAISAGDWRLFTTFRERIEQVTADDVREAACTYLTEMTRTIAWLTPE